LDWTTLNVAFTICGARERERERERERDERRERERERREKREERERKRKEREKRERGMRERPLLSPAQSDIISECGSVTGSRIELTTPTRPNSILLAAKRIPWI
jgi:FtsZ-interacting cell division protein YlmF